MKTLMRFFFQTSQQSWAPIFLESLKRRPSLNYIAEDIQAKTCDASDVQGIKEPKHFGKIIRDRTYKNAHFMSVICQFILYLFLDKLTDVVFFKIAKKISDFKVLAAALILTASFTAQATNKTTERKLKVSAQSQKAVVLQLANLSSDAE